LVCGIALLRQTKTLDLKDHKRKSGSIVSVEKIDNLNKQKINKEDYKMGKCLYFRFKKNDAIFSHAKIN